MTTWIQMWLAGCLLLMASAVSATTITLDFQTNETGKTLASGPLTTAFGDIALSCDGWCGVVSGLGPAGGFLLFDEATSDGRATLLFDGFTASQIAFDYSGQGGGRFSAEAFDTAGTVIDQFIDFETQPSLSLAEVDGRVTLSGAGLIGFSFGDYPDGQFLSSIDNVTIETEPVPAQIALPAGLPLAMSGLGLLYGLGRLRGAAGEDARKGTRLSGLGARPSASAVLREAGHRREGSRSTVLNAAHHPQRAYDGAVGEVPVRAQGAPWTVAAAYARPSGNAPRPETASDRACRRSLVIGRGAQGVRVS